MLLKCPVKIALSTALGYSNFILFSLELERELSGFVPFFEQKISGLSRTHLPFFKESIQCKKEP